MNGYTLFLLVVGMGAGFGLAIWWVYMDDRKKTDRMFAEHQAEVDRMWDEHRKKVDRLWGEHFEKMRANGLHS